MAIAAHQPPYTRATANIGKLTSFSNEASMNWFYAYIVRKRYLTCI